MRPAFEDSNLWETFKEELISWKGTPYRHLQCAKGYGGDCTFFLADVFYHLGVLNRIDRPKYYPKNWFLHTKEDIIKDRLELNFKTNTIEGFEWKYYKNGEEEIIKGDLLLFIIRPTITAVHHTGVYLGENEMFHGTVRRTFDKVDYSKWSKYMNSFYRLYESEK